MSEAEAVVVRRAEQRDLDQVSALWLRLLAEQRDLDDRFGFADDAGRRWRNDFPVWLRNTTWRIFVAERDGQVVGFVAAQRWAPPPVYAYSEEVFLNELYVVPEARRSGVGSALVAAVRQWAHDLGADRLRLSVLEANAEGRAFWEALGGTPLNVVYTIELPRESRPAPKKKAVRLGF